ncbi:MAG: hypothetical protein WC705_03240 [Candidatus Paceibacterota bacterium]|jgi:hypothetical protein
MKNFKILFSVLLFVLSISMVGSINNVQAQTAATLTVVPSSISTPTNGFYKFKAMYDPDGASGVETPRDVTMQSTWASANPAYVNAHSVMKGTFVSQNCIGNNQDVTVYAFYNSISGLALTRSSCKSAGSSLGQGTLTISARFGILDTLSGSLTSSRNLTQEEKDQVILKLYNRESVLFNTLVKADLRLDQATSLDVFPTSGGGSGDYSVSSVGLPLGWGLAKSYSCQVTVGQSKTCQIGLFKDRVDHTSDYSVDMTEGPAAILPSFSTNLVQAQFQKTVLDTSGKIMDMKMVKVSGKQILLVMASVSGGVSVYSYDATDPGNPSLLQENKIGSYVNYGNSKLIVLDDYPYVLISQLVRQPNPNYQGVDYWTYTGQIDSSGKLTQISITRFAKDYQESQAGFNDNSPQALFALGGKTYLVTSDYYTLKFFDVTSSTDHNDAKMVSQYNSEGVQLALQRGSPWNPVKVVKFSNKVYIVANMASTDSGWFHANAVDFMFVVDVSNIANPVLVFAPPRVSSLFNHDWQLNAMEKKYINRDNPHSGNVTLFDNVLSKAVHFYSPRQELAGNHANIYQTQDASEVLPKIRVRDVLAGYSVVEGSNFVQEITQSRVVVCEQRGAKGDANSSGKDCGSGVLGSTEPGSSSGYRFPYQSINFGIPLDMENGVVVSSSGKVALLTSSGILFADTSLAFGGVNSIDAVLYQKDSKNFYVFVSTSKNVKSVKLYFDQGINPPGTIPPPDDEIIPPPPSDENQTGGTFNLPSNFTTSPFSIRGLIRFIEKLKGL